MDEMNPAYENFLNNMTRLGGTPRETTRRISASSFLGRDKLGEQVALNSRKITILKNVIKAQQIQTGVMLASLSTPSEGIDQSIMDIKETMSSILQTLEAQEKFEYEKFLDTQRRLQNERRRGRETKLEKDKPVFDFFKKQVNRAVEPIKNGFLRFIMFFINLVAGKFLMGILKFLSNPANIGIVNFISGFIKNFFPLIIGGIVAATIGIAFLLGKMVGLTGLINIAASVLGIALPGSALLGGLGIGGKLGNLIKGLGSLSLSNIGKGSRSFFRSARSAFRPTRIFQDGGMLHGPSHKDGGIPIEAEGGEFVVNKKAMQQPGAAEAVQLINSGNLGAVVQMLKGMSGDEKLAGHAQVEKFFNDPKNRMYTSTTTDSEGNVTMAADGSGFKKYQQFMKDEGYEMDTYGYMPNLGKKAEDTVRGVSVEGLDGVKRNVGANTLDYFSSNYGLSLEDEINKNVVGTEAFYLNALSQSITEKGRKDAGIKPVNNVSIPGPPVVSDQDANFMLEQVGLPPIPPTDRSVATRNELPTCTLNPTDSNKCDTLGFMAP